MKKRQEKTVFLKNILNISCKIMYTAHFGKMWIKMWSAADPCRSSLGVLPIIVECVDQNVERCRSLCIAWLKMSSAVDHCGVPLIIVN